MWRLAYFYLINSKILFFNINTMILLTKQDMIANKIFLSDETLMGYVNWLTPKY